MRHIDGELPGRLPARLPLAAVPRGPPAPADRLPRPLLAARGHRAWGWAVQLYATRSRASWGIGDLADLRAVRRMAADQGAGFVLINPLHAVAPIAEQEASPYLPATRRFRNPIYLRVAEVPGADGVDLEDDAGRALSDGELIDRDAIWARKREVLMRIFFAHGGGEAFARWREEQGQTLQDWATWAAIAEEHGGDWHAWPDGAAPSRRRRRWPRYVEQHGAVVAFHAWLQWALDLQFTAATGGMTVIQDLPIGVAGGGADAWAWQEVLAEGVSVGAPPDAFNSQGQDWGSPPLVPVAAARRRLRAVHPVDPGHDRRRRRPADRPRHGPVPAVVGAGRRDAPPTAPTSATRPRTCSTSSRWRATARRRWSSARTSARSRTASARPWPSTAILSYRLLWFEDDDPAEWPAAGDGRRHHPRPAHGGRALDRRRRRPSSASTAPGTDEELERGRDVAARAPARSCRTTPRRGRRSSEAHRLLAEAPSPLLSATLDDAVGRAAAAEHAGDHRPAELVAAAAGAGRGPARRTRCCRTVARTLADGARAPPSRLTAACRSNRCSTDVPDCWHGRRHDSGARWALPRRAGGRLRRRGAGGAAARPYAAAGDGGEGRHCWVRDPPEAAGHLAGPAGRVAPHAAAGRAGWPTR